ncbi:MAG: hypothetical protein US68_C0007G0017 [Candidatus Shapirobacteria bacterium GW2011_GWE1_38_10]|uniref:Uncharacterized protein n=1 Tax=Candidatus Shapirobacteria bacterium GW2011_GWE1_38_10 TaxID=1618488 RepID=A0A0G0KM41_9BACT|nr:MAG: hypothetical protein US46_C0007G0009 [Candidatus Shapirobacteria bacterium GW2011_GWF2_37_20]KKQ50254.1 MAG: hypothetical protein US68_C0007G0017 [Candidatus Shapirobacteria bacterium GW2011_GWE1_38_10]KKQ64788.1 MAG: hypothetical protein US85_C0003G0010 [Candidatus Shapirobacteria bacterium GW2011_GWF1_38_23]HBP50811.1 hypothetical protein [Candidatus Shapirobacteria bacterium]
MRNKRKVIKCLKTTPIVQIACQQAGISRATYYRWRKENEKFRKKSNVVLGNGTNFINDLAESQLIKKIKEGNLTAIIFWLKHHHQAYREKNIIINTSSHESSKVPFGVNFILNENPKPGDKMITE